MGRSITLAAKANPGTGGGTEAQSSEDGGLGNSPHGSCLPRAVGSWEAGRGGELEVEERQNQQRQKALSEVGTECAVRWGRGGCALDRTETAAGLMRSFFQPLTACNMLRGRKMQMSWLLSAQSSHREIRSQKETCQEQRVKLETKCFLQLSAFRWE